MTGNFSMSVNKFAGNSLQLNEFFHSQTVLQLKLCRLDLYVLMLLVACCMTLLPPDDYSAVHIAPCIYLFRPS